MKKKIGPDEAQVRRQKAAKRREEKREERRRERNRRLHGVLFEYTQDVRTNAVLLEKYINSKRFKGSDSEREDRLRELLKSNAPFLAANNPEARIRFFPAWDYNLRLFTFDKPTYLVTLTPRQYVYGLHPWINFKPFKIQQWTRGELAGFDYVGIVEPAHYSEARMGSSAGPQISFHVHLIVVDPHRRLLDKRMEEISKKYPSLVEGRNSADARRVKHIDLGLAFKYMIKEPTADYRIYPMRDEITDKLGVTKKINTDKSMQKDKRLTSGVQLRVRQVTKDWHLDKMIFGGGTGSGVTKQIRADALLGLPHSKRKDRQEKFSGTFSYDGYQFGPPKAGSWVGVDSFIPAETLPMPRKAAEQ